MDWRGAHITQADGRPYARLDEVFVGRESGEPEFGIVALLDAPAGADRVAVPLEGAHPGPGDTVVLGVSRERVEDAPRIQRDVEAIPAAAGALIRAHFGLSEGPDGGQEPTVAHQPTAATTAHDAEDDAPAEVVRHEEQLAVGTRATVAERVRVRKRVITEEVTLTVSLRREELVIEREPVAPETVPSPTEFPVADGGVEAEFVLHAEEPVVTKRIVPVERVALHRGSTVEEHHLTDTVRKERVDVDRLPTDREDHPA